MCLIEITIFTVVGTSGSSLLQVLGRPGILMVGQSSSAINNSQVPFLVCAVLALNPYKSSY